MDFTNKYYAVLFEWNGIKIYLTSTLIATWVVMAVLILFAVIVRIKLRKFTEVPTSRLQMVVETMVDAMSNFVKSTMGSELAGFDSFFFGIFAFILVANYSGMFGLRPPTADLAVTMALALTVFVLIHATGIRYHKGRYLKTFIEPNPVFLPINLISEIATPISLSFRLFGNIMGGIIIMALIYELLPMVLTFVLPSALHAYFDVFVGALQAYIFTVLSMSFISQKAIVED